MKDVFKEQLVKRRPNMQTTLYKSLVVFASLILAALVLFIEILAVFAPLFWLIIIFFAYFIFRRLAVEYEYALTNNELDIDIIYGKAKRKRGFSGNVKDIEAFRQMGSSEMEHSFSSANARLNFLGNNEGVGYEFLISRGGKKTRITFEPNDDILAAILPYLKRGTYPNNMKK